ncbi:hypothetical protein QTI66_32675 [Variovorax sp. J22R133]|uniref:hypothetical protein n=1 Tax=Variovorax brevis TaxID=3053503 RepID=UPI0025755A7E|nr:hypothetical protein [Variovorax sp. J22R133]MDM0116883.1 hypothetical protein [Variovorax sp. J22R133]
MKTNTDLLATDPKLLGRIEQQHRYIVVMHSHPSPCPNPGCNQPVNIFEALGIAADDYSWDYKPGRTYRCPHCHYAPRHVVPLVMSSAGGYHWALGEALPKKEGP